MGRKAGFNVLFVLLAIGAGLFLSRKPWETYGEQKSAADKATREMQSAEASRSELLRAKAMVDTPLGKEISARKSGLIGAGERRLNSAP